MTPLRALLTASLCLALLVITAAPAQAAPTSAPGWSITSTAQPTNFSSSDPVGDDKYVVIATNDGSVPSSGQIIVTDNLPGGLAATKIEGGVNGVVSELSHVVSCTLGTLTCTTSTSIPPGISIVVYVTVTPTSGEFSTVVNTATVSGGGASGAATTSPNPNTLNSPTLTPPGISIYDMATSGFDGAPDAVAGDHPYMVTVTIGSNTQLKGEAGKQQTRAIAQQRYVLSELPLGFVGNPAVLPQCTLATARAFKCPPDTFIGYLVLGVNAGVIAAEPIYNLVPEHGYPAEFGAEIDDQLVAIYAALVPSPQGYRIRVYDAGLTQALATKQAVLTFFGDPSSMDATGGSPIPFFTNAADCSAGTLTTLLHQDYWQDPAPVPLKEDGSPDFTNVDFSQAPWTSAEAPYGEMSDCEALAALFHPTLGFAPNGSSGNTEASEPTAYTSDLKVPQSNDATAFPPNADTEFDETKGTPPLKDITVTLPRGLAINPSVANGLRACSDSASDPEGDQVRYESVEPVKCPDSTTIGNGVLVTPLLGSHEINSEGISVVNGPEEVEGSLYAIKPHPGDLAQGIYRLLLQIDSPRNGLVIKLPGIARANPVTGQITATFQDNPQLPFSDFKLNFRGGPRAVLANPDLCGTYTTHTNFTSWSGAETEDTSSFDINKGPGGGACRQSATDLPFHPSFEAGTGSTSAGAYAPFKLRIHREDGEQQLKKIAFTLPEGVLGSVRGIPYCSEAQIKAAEANSGVAEEKSPSCPASSQIGSVQTAAGAGPNPYYVGGKVYLAGPYKGAPLSAVVVTPAVAGPFDLGVVVVRAALRVDRNTSRLTAESDEIPQILGGVPLNIRLVSIDVDRPNFVINPTSCEKMTVTSTLTGVAGVSSGSSAEVNSSPSSPFQVGGCGGLGFKPKFTAKVTGPTKRGGLPAFTAELNAPEGNYANIRDVQVALPHSEFLEQAHINTVCTRVQAAAHECPAGSIYGYAEAETPLLEGKLTGPVFLKSSVHKLPDLAIFLKGPENQPVEVEFQGRIDSIHGQIRDTIEGLPDARVTHFVLKMKGGKKGLLVNSRDLCKGKPGRMTVNMVAQNNKRADSRPLLGNNCGKAKKAKKHHKRSHRRRTLSGLVAIW